MLGALVPVILAVHIIVTIFLVGLILVQKNEGGMGGLGGGASGGMAGFLSGRAQANLLTKATKWLAIGFFCTSLVLAYADSHAGKRQPLVGGSATTSAPAVPVESSGSDSATETIPVEPTTPAEPAAPAQPAAPSGQ
jgi:preprotein translocase subunit SecG